MDLDRASQVQREHAYASCRAIARSAAKNFYYGFLALPQHKRNALSAIYAFMRQADDFSDAAGLSPLERREKLADWMQQARRAFSGEATDDPVLLALADTQQQFKIPVELFEKLVQGTAMDLDFAPDSNPAAPALRYESFDQLYQYCYHVASVVGLVCLHVFGYRDPRAELLAEHCGIAFQLTNILRDLKEDAAMGRVYLPQEDFQRFGILPALLFAAHQNGSKLLSLRPLLEFEANRAREFYRSGVELIALVDQDSRGALWALIEIYRRLLERITANGYDVFHQRIALGTSEKLVILARGLWKRVTL